jgi:MFS family permease
VRAAYILFVGLFSVQIGQSILAPVLPPLVRELGLSELQGGLIMTFSSVMWVIFSGLWGRRSEVWGRKPVFVLALAGYSIGVGTFGLVMQLGLSGIITSSLLVWLLLIASRMIVGTLFSGSIPSAQAYIADTTTGQERTNAMGIISAANGLGTIFGPALGAAVIGLGLVAPIFLSALLPLVGLALVWIYLPHIEPMLKRGQPTPRVSLLDQRIWPVLVVGVTITTIMSVVQFTIAFLFQDRLLLGSAETAQAVGIALVASGAAASIAQMGLIRVFRWSPHTLLLIGMPLLLATAILLILADSFPLLTLALILQGFGIGFAFTGLRSAVSFAVTAQEQGAAAGLTSSVTGTGFILGPMLGTGLYGLNPTLPYALAAVVMLVGLMVLISHPPQRITQVAG